jgi:hypothetical protein
VPFAIISNANVVNELGEEEPPNSSLWISYEDVRSANKKVDYVKQNGLGGVSVWSLDMDDFKGAFCKIGRFPIIQSIRRELEGIVEPITELTVPSTKSTKRPRPSAVTASSSVSSPTTMPVSKTTSTTRHIDVITKAKTTMRKGPSSSPVPPHQPPVYSINNKKLFNLSFFDIDWSRWNALETRLKKFKAVREVKITACLDKNLCRVANITANRSSSFYFCRSKFLLIFSLLLFLRFYF